MVMCVFVGGCNDNRMWCYLPYQFFATHGRSQQAIDRSTDVQGIYKSHELNFGGSHIIDSLLIFLSQPWYSSLFELQYLF